MQAESSQAPRAALARSAVVTPSPSPYLAAAPAGLFASPAQAPLFDPASQPQRQQQHNQHQPPHQHPGFVNADAAFQHPAARNFQPVQDPSASSHEAAYRIPAIPRTASVIDYSNAYQQLDSHIQPHQQPPHSVPYHPHLYASTSYSALAGPGPVPSFGPDLSSQAYTHADLGLMHSNMSVPMMRYGSFPMSADDMSRAGSSNGTPGPMTQQDIDNLLAMSRAQAGNHSDASAFPCTYCDKVYTGKHARSIWRRHLQDKHNIPLSAQPRRTRWDGDVNRPKNAEERRARMLESKRRWARKKRLQEKQAAQAGKSGASNTPNPDASDDDEDDDGDDGADADVSNMSMTFSRSTDGDDSFAMVQPEAHKRDPLEQGVQWGNLPDAHFFASQDEFGRIAKRQALAPSTAHNVAGASTAPSHYPVQLPSVSYVGAQELATSGSTMCSESPVHRAGLTLAPVSQPGSGIALLSHPNDSFSSHSSDYSQPGSASFFNDSFAGNMSNSGSETATTSIDTPATTWPALPPLDRTADKAAMSRPVDGAAISAATEAQPRVQKGDTRDAAIQLLALRSGSNSPSDDREMSMRRDANGDAPWSSTPSRGKATSEHAALTALTCSTTAEKGRRKSGDVDVGLSPSPVSRTLASGSAAVRAMQVTTPGPASRSGENPFSLDKHKISPYEGRRKLSYSGGPVTPTASPTHLTFGGVSMGKSLSSSSSTSTAPLGVKLPPLVSTPLRPSSQGNTEGGETGTERVKMDSLPPLLGSASKKVVGGASMMSTPFSKPMSGLGYSALRHGGSAGGTTASGSNSHFAAMASSVRPSPSRRHSDDQFSSPQHLNLTESLGLAPHSISRTSSYASACYASSLGLTPSVANISNGLIPGTPFHSGLGALSGLGGFTPLSAAKLGAGGLAGGMAFWPESTRKSASKGSMSNGLSLATAANSPTVYKSTSQPHPATTVVASASDLPLASRGGSAKRKLSTLSSSSKHLRTKSRTASPGGDIFDADYRSTAKSQAGPSSDDTFGDDDDEDDENLMAIGALDTPSRPAALRRLTKTTSKNHGDKLAAPVATPAKDKAKQLQHQQPHRDAMHRSPLAPIKLNH